MPSNATKSTVREFVSRRRLLGRKSGTFVIAATQFYRLGLSIRDYFFMTNNSYTVTTRVTPEVDIRPADMRAQSSRSRVRVRGRLATASRVFPAIFALSACLGHIQGGQQR